MNNDKKNRSPLRNPLLIFLVISVIATVLLNVLMLSFQSPKKQEISYSDFMNMLNEDKVDEVILNKEQLTIYEKFDESDESFDEAASQTSSFMRMLGVDPEEVIKRQRKAAVRYITRDIYMMKDFLRSLMKRA